MARRAPRTPDTDTPADTDNPWLLPDDPAPADPPRRGPGRPRKATGNAGQIAVRDQTTGQIMSEASQKAKVKRELYLWLSMVVGAAEIRDPECAGLFLQPVEIPGTKQPVERLEAIVDRLVEIIARHKPTLAFMAKSGPVGDVALLGSLLLPIGRQIWRAHGPNGTGHGEEPTSDLTGYAPYAPAAR